MLCTSCTYDKTLKSTRITHKYRESGLDNVTLHGIQYEKCPKCGEEYFGYGDMEQLHALIARVLVSKKMPLTFREAKFLRKFLGLSGSEYAARIDVAHETVSRYETGKLKIPTQYDTLLRALVATKLPDRDYDLHDSILHLKGPVLKRISLSAGDGIWTLKKSA